MGVDLDGNGDEAVEAKDLGHVGDVDSGENDLGSGWPIERLR